ncbi:MAG TPA: UDP-3-O-acyl-N-acetylglucosamine deacetylase, partial [Bdellovibrionales bacterium]|nr:UDP-3-O-acyl-N-acetylglucosamine deacetylase [Bdellovibrionales bacterium]
MFLQRTIRSRTSVEGIGLHTGAPAKLTFCPAPEGTGIYFVRRDLPGSPAISTQADRVRATTMATVLGGDAFSVSTVEHCLSALAALRIDNLFIELDGPEIPIGDGSATPFLDAILKVGLAEQNEPRKYAYITQPIFMGDQDKHAYVVPYNGLRISCTIDFPHPRIGLQSMDIDITEQSFAREVARARTFGFLKDVEALRAKGLARGGSLDNAIVMSGD